MRAMVAGCAVVVIATSACTSSAGAPVDPTHARSSAHTSARPSTRPTRTATRTGSPAPVTSSSTAPPTSPAQQALDGMSLAQRVGQLLMVDCPSSGVTSNTVASIRRYHAGSVILDGNSTLGVVRTRAITHQLQDLAPPGVHLFVSTDQEGGLVQRLRGPGFSTIPSAVVQGSEPPSAVRSSAQLWGSELRSAGINVDLAPVLDTVPPGGIANPPIGDLDREYGHTAAQVARAGIAVAHGLVAAGVAPTAKHFPGLGRVTGNTDISSGVTDTVTTRHDPYLTPFVAAIKARMPFVMVSTAIYARIDPSTPAIFSRTIVTDMLRGDLGFTGVIITDDVGAAAQVAADPPGQRAVRFIQAGGTMVLTVVPSTVGPMATALLQRARRDPAFRQQVNAAALVVLQVKAAEHLLG